MDKRKGDVCKLDAGLILDCTGSLPGKSVSAKMKLLILGS